ncbi:unnamed protein product [Clavelina lepadiformis]|uniref:Uncharacterized protein n=1 Tax=Clavelina lepadiformis TaxID=159417 RepID=A0ABP0FCG9_CLALP
MSYVLQLNLVVPFKYDQVLDFRNQALLIKTDLKNLCSLTDLKQFNMHDIFGNVFDNQNFAEYKNTPFTHNYQH